jgi:uncharacterized membrane protein
MSDKNNNKLIFSIVVVLVISWVVAFIYEAKLPQKIPTHWNIHGEVDGYTNKPWGVYMLPLISTVTSFLLLLLPKIAPKGFKLDSAKSVYEIIVLIMAIFMMGVMVLTFEAALNKAVDVNQWIMVGLGVLFIVIGNYLSKVPKNFFLGIRTPWTLSSDEVWYKTHRLGSWVFVICGMLTLLGGLLSWPMVLMIIILSAAGLVPFIYSLIIYKNIEGFNE